MKHFVNALKEWNPKKRTFKSFEYAFCRESAPGWEIDPGDRLEFAPQGLGRWIQPYGWPECYGIQQMVSIVYTKEIYNISPGQKISYITDVIYSAPNKDKIMELARDSDHLFIEAVFLEKDRELAWKKGHLTARQAGELAARSGAKQFSIFHFSPRYTDQEDLLYQEAREAYARHI